MNFKGILVSLAASGLMLYGCNSSGGGTAPVTANELVGTWFFTTGSYQSNTLIRCPGSPDSTDVVNMTATFTDTTDRIVFAAAMTYSLDLPIEFGDGTETGTWSVSGSTLTLISGGGAPDTTLISVSISGSTLSAATVENDSGVEMGCNWTSSTTINTTLTKRP